MAALDAEGKAPSAPVSDKDPVPLAMVSRLEADIASLGMEEEGDFCAKDEMDPGLEARLKNAYRNAFTFCTPMKERIAALRAAVDEEIACTAEQDPTKEIETLTQASGAVAALTSQAGSMVAALQNSRSAFEDYTVWTVANYGSCEKKRIGAKERLQAAIEMEWGVPHIRMLALSDDFVNPGVCKGGDLKIYSPLTYCFEMLKQLDQVLAGGTQSRHFI